jgi:predicted nucleic acid-binding protein
LSKRIVLDASAAIHLVLESPYAETLADALSPADVSMAPDLFDSEVANGLWKYVRSGVLAADQAVLRLARAFELVDSVFPSRVLAREALAAATTHAHPVYDLTYAVLARRHEATVVTMDHKFFLLLQRMEIAVFCPLAEAKAQG